MINYVIKRFVYLMNKYAIVNNILTTKLVHRQMINGKINLNTLKIKIGFYDFQLQKYPKLLIK